LAQASSKQASRFEQFSFFDPSTMASSHLKLVFRVLVLLFVPLANASDVATLNRVTFAGNIFANREGEGPEGWMVLFCVDWYKPCQDFQDAFLSTATQYGGVSDDEVLSRTTRFAQVDCAVDKVLCNSQDVAAYPTVVHYRRGGRAGEWSQSGRSAEKEAASFQKWTKKQMQQADTLGKDVAVDGHSDSTHQDPIAKFSMGVPVGQALPMMMFLVAGTMWVTRLGVEFWQMIQFLREPSEPRIMKAPMENLAEPAELVNYGPAVVRCLPETWAGKGCLEL